METVVIIPPQSETELIDLNNADALDILDIKQNNQIFVDCIIIFVPEDNNRIPLEIKFEIRTYYTTGYKQCKIRNNNKFAINVRYEIIKGAIYSGIFGYVH